MQPDPAISRFVRSVLRAELARGGGARGPEGTQRLFAQLHQGLAKLIGSAGVDVLLARAVVLARRDHPVLAEIALSPGGKLVGLDEGAAQNGIAVQEGAIAIVSHFIELLVTLIGEDLTMRLVGDVWPEATKEEEK
jgi:hypothetical protein